MCIRILMILVVVSGYTAKPSDETKVVWNPVTPMEFGKDVKLVCNISCCVRNTALDQASWDAFINNKSINIAANSHSRYPSKYSLLIWEDKCTLVIKNFSLSDVNVNYTCTYNFKSFNKKLKLNKDDFELQPKEDIKRLVHDRVDRNSYFLGVNFTNVYPEPKCFVLHNGQDFTSNIVSKTSISGYFYTSYQTIIINDVKDGNIRMNCSIGKTTYMVKDKEFKLIVKAQLKNESTYVRIGGAVILQCPINGLESVVTWRYNQEVYSMSTEINTDIPHHKRLAVVGNHSAGEYFLQIMNITDVDLGTYICVSTSDTNVVDSSTQLMLMVPPSYLSIVGHTSNVFHTEEDSKVNLTCKVIPGIPSEYLYWKSGNKTFVNGSGEIEYNFQVKRSDHLKVFECIAIHEALIEPLRKTLQLILSEKPRVRIAVYPGTEVQVGENVTLSCVMDNLFDLRSLTWLKDDTILPFRSTELCITDAQTRDAGIYKCSVVNQWGEGYSYVTFNVKEKTHPYDVNDVTYLTSQWTNTSERYDNGKRQQTPFLLIIASGTSFVIVSFLLASSVVIYRRSHGAAHLESVNPNSENPPPNRSDNVEYETIDELQDGIIPHQNVPSGTAASTMEIATVEIFTHSKSNSTSTDDSSSRSLRSLSDYINPYCSLNADVIHKKNEYEFCLYKANYDTSSEKEVKKCSNTI